MTRFGLLEAFLSFLRASDFLEFVVGEHAAEMAAFFFFYTIMIDLELQLNRQIATILMGRIGSFLVKLSLNCSDNVSVTMLNKEV